MFRKFCFQFHWLVGITVGLVLAVVGVSGGLLSFEQAILRHINRKVVTVIPAPGATVLAPSELLEAARSAAPGRTVVTLTLHARSDRAAVLTLAGSGPAARRGESLYVNPYTGEAQGGALRGQPFFRNVRRLHRWLLMDALTGNRDAGRQVVGASTVLLILLVISGIVLRSPGQLRSWRAWLTFSPKRKGRAFLWEMHAVVGTWVAPLYLLASLTGLYWSYEGYRNVLHRISGVPRVVRGHGPPAGGGGRGEQRPPEAPQPDPGATLDRAWALFRETVGDDYSWVMIRLPQTAATSVRLTYLDARARHDRALSRMTIDVDEALVADHDRYADRPLPVRLMGSMLPLHSASYFGVVPTALMMAAALAMPLFTVTGWMMYLQRRRQNRAARRAMQEARSEGLKEDGKTLPILYASQGGFGKTLAWQSATALQQAGQGVTVKELGRVTPAFLAGQRRVLFVVSTFGLGISPTGARPFVVQMHKTDLSNLQYGLLSLGDRRYGELYCKFGRELEIWLRDCGARPLFATVEVDDGNPDALQEWQRCLLCLKEDT